MAYLLFLLTGWMLFMRGTVAQATRQAMESCLFVLVPTLFPCMVLCLCLLRYVDAPPKFLKKLWRYLGLPDGSFYPFWLGLLGGYPTGARLLADMKSKNRISKAQARAALGFCVNPSISFVLGFWDSLGWVFYLCLFMCDLMLGMVLCRAEEESFALKNLPHFGTILSESIFSATQSMLAVLGSTVFFSAVRACLGAHPRLYGMDITSELLELGAGGEKQMLLAAMLTAFGGLSVFMQVRVLCDFAGVGFLLCAGIKGAGVMLLMLLAQKKGTACAAAFGGFIIIILAALKQRAVWRRWSCCKDTGCDPIHHSKQEPFRRQTQAPRFHT